MEIKKLAYELEFWAQEKGWKTVTQLITLHHFGDLLQSLDDVSDPDEYARRLHNNKQIIQRAFRNDTPNYLKQAEALSYAIRTAIDNELAQKDCMHYRAARVNKECIEATNAVFTGKPQPVIRRETLEAIDALAQMAGVKVQIMHCHRAA
ncbi:toxin YdaT family protein [uncultured Enterobacter sp.]|uniref:toxin YdaT family protein n=1 Tax=uncultured Enterobacter sp. TaxID=238202 RepID=UPI00259265F7|nr:toxin YdaT family protein [uncultured Enterobacter sp.]